MVGFVLWFFVRCACWVMTRLANMRHTYGLCSNAWDSTRWHPFTGKTRRNGISLLTHVWAHMWAHMFLFILCRRILINQMCKRSLPPIRSDHLTDGGSTASIGAEYRVKTSCPSCGIVRRVSSSYRPCQEAVHRGVGVCKRVEGSSLDIRWLCGSRKCEELADIHWEEECQSKTLEADRT